MLFLDGLTFHIGEKQTEHRPGWFLTWEEKWLDVSVGGFVLGTPEHGHLPGLCAQGGLSEWMHQAQKALLPAPSQKTNETGAWKSSRPSAGLRSGVESSLSHRKGTPVFTGQVVMG